MMELIQRPVLVVIDDIDRCEPKFIVEMMRGLQTILMSPRVVYLLLGDRSWIEQAFEVYHKDMREIDIGQEHSFGGRFVEKAIQLSFVLPNIGSHQESYVRKVLAGNMGQQIAKTDLAPISDQEIVTENIEHSDVIQSPTSRAEMVLQQSSRREAEEALIGHRLEPLAPLLPGNPRHIKRIINTIFMYQNSVTLTEEEVDLNGDGEWWRLLAAGVVLMVGFPNSWATLTRNPDWIPFLTSADDEFPANTEANLELNSAYKKLLNNENFIKLLGKTETPTDKPFVNIGVDEISWLNRVIPLLKTG